MELMFSRKTIIAIVKALNFQTHDEVARFCLEYFLDGEISGNNLKEKETSIAKYLIFNPEALGPDGSALSYELIDYAIKRHRRDESFSTCHPELVLSLDRDGFVS